MDEDQARLQAEYVRDMSRLALELGAMSVSESMCTQDLLTTVLVKLEHPELVRGTPEFGYEQHLIAQQFSAARNSQLQNVWRGMGIKVFTGKDAPEIAPPSILPPA